MRIWYSDAYNSGFAKGYEKGKKEAQAQHKKGKWLHEHIASDTSITGYYLSPECSCSECGVVITCETNYCPNCGARMDGDSDE